jgi:outer membrane protein assembly factor BamB
MLRKVNLIVLSIVTLSARLPVLAQDDSPKIELTTVYEKNLDEVIVDAIFDTATVPIETAKSLGWEQGYVDKVKTRGELKIEYPSIVKISRRGEKVSSRTTRAKNSSYYVKELRFYDSNNSITKNIPISWGEGYEYIYSSPQKKYLLVSKQPTEYNPEYSGGVLYDSRGNKIVEIQGPSPVAVSDEGLMIAANLDWQEPFQTGGSFYLYDKNGRLVKEIGNPDKERAAAFFAKFSPDGQYAVLSFSGSGAKPTYFYIVDKRGGILGHCDLPEYRFSARTEEMDEFEDEGFAVILDKISAGAFGLDWKQYLFFFDWSGNLKWQVPLKIRGDMAVEFSEDGSKIYVISGAGYLWCADTKNGNIIWEHKEAWAPEPGPRRWPSGVPIFRELKIRGDKVFVIGKRGSDWDSSTLFVFDGKTGNLLEKIEYPQEKITFGETHSSLSLINISDKSFTILE